MPREERKRHYSNMARKCRLDPALAARFRVLKSDKDKFDFLRESLLAESEAVEVKISEATVTAKTTENKDRFRKLTKFQLQQLYGSSPAALAFIEQLCAGQTGEYHPQAPNYSPGKRYRILKDTVENVGNEMRDESKVGVFKKKS